MFNFFKGKKDKERNSRKEKIKFRDMDTGKIRYTKPEEILSPEEEEKRVSNLLNKIFEALLLYRATDLKIDYLQERKPRIRFKVDGLYRVVKVKDLDKYAKQLVARLEVLAKKNTYADSAQDGSFTANIHDSEKNEQVDIQFRISTIPTVTGKMASVRVLDPRRFNLTLGQQGHHGRITKFVKEVKGLFLVVGPPGSGKTTTIYAILKQLVHPGINCITMEDPVEYRLEGVNQIEVHRERDRDFANILDSYLRADTELALFGEIRKLREAEIAIQAALTGTTFISTAHCENAIEAILRLWNMGINPYDLSVVLSGVMSQRLVRRVCEHCVDTYTPRNEDIIKVFGEIPSDIEFYHGTGCKLCTGTGFYGRLAVSEIWIKDEELQEMIAAKVSAALIAKKSKEKGMLTMLDDCRLKIDCGYTTVEEVIRQKIHKIK